MRDDPSQSRCLVPSFFGEGCAGLSPDFLAFPTGDPDQLRLIEDLLQERVSLNLARLPRILSHVDGRNGVWDQTRNIINRLGKLDEGSRRSLLGAPLFMTWLDGALDRSRTLTDLASLARLRLHLTRLPLLVLPWLARLGSSQDESYHITLTDDGLSGPLDVRWSLRSTRPNEIGTLLLKADRAEIQVDGRPATRLAPDAFVPAAGPEGVRILDSDAIRLVEREFAGDGQIEIGAIRDFPTLTTDLKALPEQDDPNQARTAIDGGLQALSRLWPQAHREVRFLCRLVTPVRFSDGHNNATHGSYMFVQMLTSNQGDSLKHAEVLLHEAMHCKLFGTKELTKLIENDGPARYRHPWRQDLRPLRGVLAGAHAFLAVLALYRRAERFREVWPEARDTAGQLTDEVGRALGVLRSEAEFTPNGRMMFDAMVRNYERTLSVA
jgi:HEXXH motif-containing protein